MLTTYLKQRTLFPPQIEITPAQNLGIVIVIPCYHEPDLLSSLAALHQAKSPNCAIEIIIVINDGEQTSEAIKAKNAASFEKALSWAKDHSTAQKYFHVLYHQALPHKKAGVGLARKIGMDEAAYRLEAVGNPQGIIVGFDADTLCQQNYFQAIEDHFATYPEIQAASIYYEHPLAGEAYEADVYKAITQYELHLRYFTLAKRFANYPHAFETIGSSMAVRAVAYQQQGGMNTRKAGEDFYFLNKFIVLGKLNELNTTTVIPSPRVSDRVPFGTGKAVGDMLSAEGSFSTYAYASFLDLKAFLVQVPALYQAADFDWQGLPQSISQFLNKVEATKKIQEIKQNTTNYESFEKRFFRWFDPFMLMKYVHFCRDHFYENISVVDAGRWIVENYYKESVEGGDARAFLKAIRALW